MERFLTPLDEAYYLAKKRGQKELKDYSDLKVYVAPSIWTDHFKPSLSKKFKSFTTNLNEADCLLFWSDHSYQNFIQYNKNALDKTGKFKLPVLVIEDGFLRSVCLYSNRNLPAYNKKWSLSCSYTLASFPHYDIREIGSLEQSLIDKDFTGLTEFKVNRARKAMKLLADHKISKYNNQQNYALSQKVKNSVYSPRKNDYRILILDQSYGDQSVVLSKADKNTFRIMLHDALSITNNVSIKVHPEQFSGRRKGYYTVVQSEYQVHVDPRKYPSVCLIGEPINPIELLTHFDEVWTCSSQLGFEALMLGKKVKTYGLPFYAGYGLTDDYMRFDQVLQRRPNRTLEEVFYKAYIDYSNYCNPFDVSAKWEIEDVIDFLKDQIDQWRIETGNCPKLTLAPSSGVVRL